MLLRVLRSGFIVDPAMINDFIAAILLGFYAMLRVSEFTNQLGGLAAATSRLRAPPTTPPVFGSLSSAVRPITLGQAKRSTSTSHQTQISAP